VAIRFHVPALAPERLAFAYSPLLEAVLSLHVVLEPKHHALQHEWVRRMRSLPPKLRKRIGDFAFAYRRTLPDLLAPSPEAELRSFEEELAALTSRDETTLALEFLRPVYDHAGHRDARLLSRADVRREALANAAALGSGADVASLIFDDPRRLAREFAELVAEYWQAAFAQEWERLEPRLAAAVSDAGRRIAADGLYAFLRGLSPRLRVDPAREEFGLDVPHDHRVEVTEEDRLVLVPSAFVWPHVQLNCDPPWPLNVVYPASFVVADARPRIPSADLVRVLRALADDTRLRALKLIAERPRSTQELAPLVGISEAGLSKHLRQLAAAGVVATRREGYYVLYSLVPERLEPLSETLGSFLAGDA
jgi:DNA-binding transcriptional ArsR family regulator